MTVWLSEWVFGGLEGPSLEGTMGILPRSWVRAMVEALLVAWEAQGRRRTAGGGRRWGGRREKRLKGGHVNIHNPRFCEDYDWGTLWTLYNIQDDKAKTDGVTPYVKHCIWHLHFMRTSIIQAFMNMSIRNFISFLYLITWNVDFIYMLMLVIICDQCMRWLWGHENTLDTSRTVNGIMFVFMT